MVTLLTHRYRDLQYEVKVTKHHHHMMRLRYMGRNGVIEFGKWQRVVSATIKQLRKESIATEWGD